MTAFPVDVEEEERGEGREQGHRQQKQRERLQRLLQDTEVVSSESLRLTMGHENLMPRSQPFFAIDSRLLLTTLHRSGVPRYPRTGIMGLKQLQL